MPARRQKPLPSEPIVSKQSMSGGRAVWVDFCGFWSVLWGSIVEAVTEKEQPKRKPRRKKPQHHDPSN
jgi:hypothetical protein